jgi:para-aminobenzoate synthetase/4-amino-4-deoxychorismate lyase
LCARALHEVPALLDAAARAVEAGCWVAGFVAYEAGAALDSALPARATDGPPLAWFGVYDAPEQTTLDAAPQPPALAWTPALDEAAYREGVARIRGHIAAGDTYQVNLTFPLRAAFDGDPLAWFAALAQGRHGGHAAYVDTGSHAILSLSPELFFALDGEQITCRPMKGTRPRGRWSAEDLAIAEALAAADKDRAENLMIVDMVRNDLGRIAEGGSVQVARLFEVERYPTVWQMTSTVTARTRADLPGIFAALFPSASVTGAPKIKTCELIHALEPGPRGVYCGAVGWWGPDRQARFNVAIRTITVDRARGTAVYPVGSGIVWDSDPAQEYRECLQKAALLRPATPGFDLLETLRHDTGGYHLLDEHLERMAASATYFGFPVDVGHWRDTLAKAARDFPEGTQRVRALLDPGGALRVEHAPLPAPRPWRVALAQAPVDSTDRFLYHKTTHRAVYDQARAARPDCDDVILHNERGELTEACFGNLVLEIDGARLTPALPAGLLPGTFRRVLLARGEITEATLTPADLHRASQVWIINSVRRWVPTEIEV